MDAEVQADVVKGVYDLANDVAKYQAIPSLYDDLVSEIESGEASKSEMLAAMYFTGGAEQVIPYLVALIWLQTSLLPMSEQTRTQKAIPSPAAEKRTSLKSSCSMVTHPKRPSICISCLNDNPPRSFGCGGFLHSLNPE